MNLNYDYFDDEERQYLNSICSGGTQASMTKAKVMESLAFAKSITDDDALLELVSSTQSKMENLTDEEWDELKKQMPFPVMISADELGDDENEENPLF